MTVSNQNLAVLGYANGFTLWHHSTDKTIGETLEAGYFDGAANLLRPGDFVFLNSSVEGSLESHLLTVVRVLDGRVTVSGLRAAA